MQDITIPEKAFLLKNEGKNNILNDRIIALNNKKLLNCQILNENLKKNLVSEVNVYCFNFTYQQKSVIVTLNTDESNIIEKTALIPDDNMLKGKYSTKELSLNKRLLSYIESNESRNFEHRSSTGNITQSLHNNNNNNNNNNNININNNNNNNNKNNNKMERLFKTQNETMSTVNSMTFFSGKYIPLNKLGQGATATIKLVKKVGKDDTIYVAKEYRKREKNETIRKYLKKIASEYCIGSSLHHENIIKTFDLIEDRDGKWYEISEYCSGGSLYEKVNSGKLKDIHIKNCYFKQILFGVQYLHSMGVCHRDLKPENVMLDEAQRCIKIIDFGVSAVFRSVFDRKKRLVNGFCGSQPYIPPEEYDDTHDYDGEKVDVWACGIIYYFMIFTEIPWGEATINDAYYQSFLSKGKDSFPDLELLSPESTEGLLKILNPNPKTRIKLSELLKSNWIQGIQSCGSTDDYNSHGPSSSGVGHHHVALDI